MLKIAIIIGSVRPNRKGRDVGEWVYNSAVKSNKAEFELVDLEDYHLPILDEPVPASKTNYEHGHTIKWSVKMAWFDAYIFVTPEYNHGTSGALKNALDFLYAEWNNKSAGFVSYGHTGGIRAVEQLRPIMGTLQIADVRTQVALSFHSDFKDNKPTPHEYHEKSLNKMIDEIVAWGEALKPLRQ
jgi:NAD(P)H-dependent FMN reductase